MREEVSRAMWWENPRQRDHLEDLGVDGRILKLIFKMWDGWGTNWIDLAHNRDRWPSVVNAIINFRVA
jgi:hypothetical protein